MTTREFVTMAMELTDNADFLEKGKAILESIEKSNSRKSTSKSKDFAELEIKIAEYLDTVDKATATDIAKACGVTSQKIAPRLTKMMGDGGITFDKVKGVKHWYVA